MKSLFRFFGFTPVFFSTVVNAQNKTVVFEGKNLWVYPYRFEIKDHFNNFDLTYARDEEEDFAIPPYPGTLKDGEYLAWYQYSRIDSAEGIRPRIAACFSVKSGKPEGRCRFFHYLRSKKADSAFLEMSGNYKEGEKEGLWQGTIYSNAGFEVGHVSMNYKRGLLEGLFKASFMNGEVLQGSYNNNQKNGGWTQSGKRYYFEKGKRKGGQSDTVGVFVIKYELEMGVEKPAEIKIYNRFNGNLEYRISEISSILNYQNYIKAFEVLDPFLMSALKVFEYDFLNRNEYRIQIFNEGQSILNVAVNETFDKPEKLSYTKNIDYQNDKGEKKHTQFTLLYKPLPGFGNYCKSTTADGVLLEEIYFTDHAEKKNLKKIKMESAAFEYYHQKHKSIFGDGKDHEESYFYRPFTEVYNSARQYIKYYADYEPRYFISKQGGFISGSVLDSTVFVDTFPFLYRLTKNYVDKGGNFLQVIEMFDRKGNKILKDGTEYLRKGKELKIRKGLYNVSDPRIETVKYCNTIIGKYETDEESLRSRGYFYYSEYENYVRKETNNYWGFPETEIYNNEILLVDGKPYTGEVWFMDTTIIYGDSDKNKQHDLPMEKIVAEKSRLLVKYYNVRSKDQLLYSREIIDIPKKILKITYKEGKREGNFFFLREQGKDTFWMLKHGNYKNGSLIGLALNPSGEWYQNYDKDSVFCMSLLNFEVSADSDTSKQEGVQYVVKRKISQRDIILSEEEQQKPYLVEIRAKENYSELLKTKTRAHEIKKGEIKGPSLIETNYYWLRTNISEEGFGDTIDLLYSTMDLKTRIVMDKMGNGKILNYAVGKKQYYLEQLYKIRNGRVVDTSYHFYENGAIASYSTGWEKNNVKIEKEREGNTLKLLIVSPRLSYDEKTVLLFSNENKGRYPELRYSEYNMSNLKNMIDKTPLKEMHFNKSGQKVAEGKNSGFGETGIWHYYYPDGKAYMTILSFTASGFFPKSDRVYCYLPNGSLYYSASVEKEESDMDCESLITIPAIVPKDIYFDVQPQKYLIKNDTWVYLKQYRQNTNLYAEGWYNLSGQYKDSVWKFYSKSGVLNEIGKYQKNIKEGRWLSGNLTGINYLDNACFDPSDSVMIKRQMNNLQFTISVYKEGQLLKESISRVDKNEYTEGPGYLQYNYWFETVDAKLSRSEMTEKGYYKPARIVIYLD